MSDLHSGESRRITEMNTNDLEKLLREDALGQETDPEEVDALFEIMQELALSRPTMRPAEIRKKVCTPKRMAAAADCVRSCGPQRLRRSSPLGS